MMMQVDNPCKSLEYPAKSPALVHQVSGRLDWILVVRFLASHILDDDDGQNNSNLPGLLLLEVAIFLEFCFFGLSLNFLYLPN